MPSLPESLKCKLLSVVYTLTGLGLCLWTVGSLQTILKSSRPVTMPTVSSAAETKREAALAAPLILLNELRSPGRWILPILEVELVTASEPTVIEKVKESIQQNTVHNEIYWLERTQQITNLLASVTELANSSKSVDHEVITRELDLSTFLPGLRIWLLEREGNRPLLAIYGQWLNAGEPQYFGLKPRQTRVAESAHAGTETLTLIDTVLLNRLSSNDTLKMQFGKSNKSSSEVSSWLAANFWELQIENARTVAATKDAQILYAFPCSTGGSWLIWIEYA